jgi:hypothetical protein
MRHVWMPPVMQVFSADKLGIVISCGHVSGLDEAAFHEPRACMEIGGSSPNQKCELVGSLSHAGCLIPSYWLFSLTCSASFSHPRRHPAVGRLFRPLPPLPPNFCNSLPLSSLPKRFWPSC